MKVDFDYYLKDWAVKLRTEASELLKFAEVVTLSPGSINRTEMRNRIETCQGLLADSAKLLDKLERDLPASAKNPSSEVIPRGECQNDVPTA